MKLLSSFLFLLFFCGSAVFAQTNTFPPSGNVGIGTTSPAHPLHINAGANARTAFFSNANGNIEFGPMNSQGAHIYTDRNLFFFNKPLHIISNPGRVSSYLDYPLVFRAGPTDIMFITHIGNVGIGVTNPTNKLEVNGTIKTKEVNVTLSGWPDYVFDPAYNLMPLQELGTYVKENRHLPEIPTEKEVEENGVDLGQMNKLLLKKVEELTLYLIEQEKGMLKLRLELEELKKNNEKKPQ